MNVFYIITSKKDPGVRTGFDRPAYIHARAFLVELVELVKLVIPVKLSGITLNSTRSTI